MQLYFYNPLVVAAILVGIFQTIRKLEVARREAAHHTNVAPEDFERWKSAQMGAYSLSANACFARLLLGFLVYVVVAADGRVTGPETVLAAGVDAAWVAALIVAWRKSVAARKLADELHLDLGPLPPPPSNP